MKEKSVIVMQWISFVFDLISEREARFFRLLIGTSKHCWSSCVIQLIIVSSAVLFNVSPYLTELALCRKEMSVTLVTTLGRIKME